MLHAIALAGLILGSAIQGSPSTVILGPYTASGYTATGSTANKIDISFPTDTWISLAGEAVGATPAGPAMRYQSGISSIFVNTNLVLGSGSFFHAGTEVCSASGVLCLNTAGTALVASGVLSVTSGTGSANTLDCGGGTCAVNVGTANATTTSIGRASQGTNINGNVQFNGAQIISGTVAASTNFCISSSTTCTTSAESIRLQGNGVGRAMVASDLSTDTNVSIDLATKGAGAIQIPKIANASLLACTASTEDVTHNQAGALAFDSTNNALAQCDGTRWNYIELWKTCTMSASTTCTATVPSGTVCMCQSQSGTQGTTSCAVSGTTATCTAGAVNSTVWNIQVH